MKRMRYLAGAAGLTPMAFVMVAVPSVPHAANAPDAAVSHPKKVSLDHVTRNTGCKGSTEVFVPSNFSAMTFWYTREGNGLTCIGTVEYSESAIIGPGFDQRTRIRVPPGNSFTAYSHYNGGTVHIGIGDTFAVGVHSSFGAGNVQVCTAMVKSSTHHTLVQGPLCATVP